MSTIGKLSAFDVKDGNWRVYVDRVEMFYKVNKVTEDMKLPILISAVGDAAYELMVTLCSPDKPGDLTYAYVVKTMENHLQPPPSVLAERFRFRQCRQIKGQSVKDYVAELKKLSRYCEFKTTLNENMRDQFACGINNDLIRQRLFTELKLDFEKAVSIASNLEAAERDALAVDSSGGAGPAVEGVHHARATGSPAAPGTSFGSASRQTNIGAVHYKNGCTACGDRYHNMAECRFQSFVCSRCGKMGHLRRVCPNPSEQGGKPAGRGRVGAATGRGARSRWPRGRSGPPRRSPNDLNWLQDECQQTEETEYCSEEECINQMSLANYKAVSIPVSVNNVVIDMEIDTGCPLSCVSDMVYGKLFKSVPLMSCDLVLNVYDYHKIVPLGYINVPVECNNVRKNLDLYVIKNGNRATNLLGRQWIAELGLSVTVPLPVNFVVPKTENEIVNDILCRHKELFDGGLGRFTGGTATLRVRPGAAAVFHRARPLPYALRERVDAELDSMLSAGIIEPVDASDWATPLVPIRKPDGGLRICADYKVTLNKVLLDDKYPVPKIEDVFSSLSGSTYFTKLDLSQAYSQVLLDEESKRYTVINTHRGLFTYNRLVFGLASSPGIFQRLMSNLIQGIENVVVFYDDILITGCNLKQHLSTVNTVLARLQEHGLKLKKEKCVFLQEKVTYLGYIIGRNGVSVDTSKIKPIVDMPYPSNVSELRSFLGMVNFYAKFVKHLSSHLAPLHALLKKYTKWQWGEQQIKAFDQVKSLLSSAEVLAHYDPSLPVVVTSDASSFALGAVLAQRYADGSERPLAYASRALTAAERNYSQIHKEALSIYFAIKRFHQYLYGRRFSLRTDHKPLVSIFGPNVGVPSMTASRLQRWALYLSAYDFDIEYVKSEQNVADVLSRLIRAHKISEVENEKKEPEQTYLHFASDALLLDYKVLKKETSRDPLLSRVTSFILDGWPDSVEIEQLKPFLNRKRELYLELGCIMWGHRVVIPGACQDKVIRELHEAHMGVVKTKALARSYAWFPGIDEMIERTCGACGVCAATASAPPAHAPRAWPWPERPWTRLHLDFLGPIAGAMYLVMVDSCSKWIEAIKMGSTTASAVIAKLRDIWARFGIPKQVVSDNGPPFSSQEFQLFTKTNGVEHIFSAPYHPASNGAAESAVKICKHVLIKAQKQQINAEVALSRFLLVYRNTVHSSTGDSPANILQGRSLRTRLDCLKPERGAHAREAQARQQRAAGGAQRGFRSGETVWYRNYSSKNSDKWLEGIIKESLGSTDYAVQAQTGDVIHRHVDQLKRRSQASLLVFPSDVAQPENAGPGSPGERGGVGTDGAQASSSAQPLRQLPPRSRNPPIRYGFEEVYP